ncbi:MAG TPA: carbonic anhydrase [Pirellulales bacterium]|jgi:carbonic anhydrase|nr:carbonic anhydrase [Pirellulales bacterium]
MDERKLSRRKMLASAGSLGLGLCAVPAVGAEVADGYPADPAAALERLKAGNERFVRDEARPQHVGHKWREMITKQQHPYATVLGCSDSRVPPELVFDEGFGDLFIMRVAGNVIADDVMGSLSYAADHLHTQVFLVLGHEGCGAVTAAVGSLLGHTKEAEHIEALLQMITPGLQQIDLGLPRQKLISAAVEANVRYSMRQVAVCPQAAQALDANRAILVGAVYDLETGRVRLLDDE